MSASTQKVLYLQSKQGSFVVQSKEIPRPRPGEIVVKIKAASLNPIDWKIQKYGIFIENYPAILGGDVAGDVEEVGEGVTGFSKGDRVVYQSAYTNETSGFQQYGVTVPNVTTKLPAKISYDEASSIPIGIAAAFLGLYNAAPHGFAFKAPVDASSKGVHSGTPLVLLGGATSVGQYVIQLAKVSGLSPIIVTASLKHTEYLKSLGATHVIDRHLPLSSLRSEVSKITDAPIKHVYDSVSMPHTQIAGYDLLASGGALAVLLPVAVEKKVEDKAIISISSFAVIPFNDDGYKNLYGSLTGLLEDGAIRPNKAEVLPNGLNGIVEGLQRLENDQVSGVKLVAHPQETQ